MIARLKSLFRARHHVLVASMIVAMLGCQGQSKFQTALCVGGSHEQYAVSEWILPVGPQEFALDMDGDGKPENRFGGFVQAANTLAFFDFGQSVNAGLRSGKGVVLLDIQQAGPSGCSAVSVNLAMPTAVPPAFDGTDTFQSLLGEPWLTLPVTVSGAEVDTLPTSHKKIPDPKSLDLYLALGTGHLPFRLFEPTIHITKLPDGTLEGQINGTVKSADLDNALTVPVAKEVTQFINSNYDQPFKIGSAVAFLESTTESQNKCLVTPEYCCKSAPKTCVILPSEMRRSGLVTNGFSPDVYGFSADELRIDPNGMPKSGASFGIRFRAKRAIHQQLCPSGTFCRDPRISPTENLKRAWGTASSDVWAVGDAGVAYHFDGLNWIKTITGSGGLSSVTGNSADNIAVLDFTSKNVHLWNGFVWRRLTMDRPGDLRDIYIDPDNHLYGALFEYASGALLRLDGDKWTTVNTTTSGLYQIRTISGDLWIGGYTGLLLQYHAGTWINHGLSQTQLANTSIWGIWGSGNDDVWIVGSAGACRHFTGEHWDTNLLCNGRAEYKSLWGYKKDQIWMGDAGGRIRFLDRRDPNNVWQEWRMDPPAAINGLWGSRRNEVWAVGDNGTILRYQP